MKVWKRSSVRHGGVSSRTSWPELGEQLCGRRDRAHALRVDRDVRGWSGRDCDAEARRRLRGRLRERPLGRRRPPGIARLVAGQDVEEMSGVLDAPGQRPRGGEALERPERRGRNAAAGRLQPEEATARCRDPDRPSSVRRVSGRNEAGCECRRCAAARPSGRELRAPRVPCRAVQLRLGERDRPELGRVRLADDHEPRLTDAADDRGVEVRDVLGVRARGVRRPDARSRCEILHRDRHPAERSIARGRVEGTSSRERLLGAHRDERVEEWVEPLDPLERDGDELLGRDLAAANELRLLDGREERELHRGEPTSVGKWRGPDLNRLPWGNRHDPPPSRLMTGNRCVLPAGTAGLRPPAD